MKWNINTALLQTSTDEPSIVGTAVIVTLAVSARVEVVGALLSLPTRACSAVTFSPTVTDDGRVLVPD